MPKQIDQLIINSPYEEPSRYWSYRRDMREFTLKEGRRPAGYLRASEKSHGFDDPGVFVELPVVNQIRPRVKAWREAGYPGVSGITKRLRAVDGHGEFGRWAAAVLRHPGDIHEILASGANPLG